ncbi:hypothetical protein, partial [Teredinibacter waterburyi]|uniref:hypothetical protein n=1 Tax=Teredinibacter waterburyi TaxID=1500538 RepID=UPI001CAA8A68
MIVNNPKSLVKTFSRFIFGLTLVALTACGGGGSSNPDPSPQPTVEPTAEPTQAPTPEPTAVPDSTPDAFTLGAMTSV